MHRATRVMGRVLGSGGSCCGNGERCLSRQAARSYRDGESTGGRTRSEYPVELTCPPVPCSKSSRQTGHGLLELVGASCGELLRFTAATEAVAGVKASRVSCLRHVDNDCRSQVACPGAQRVATGAIECHAWGIGGGAIRANSFRKVLNRQTTSGWVAGRG